MDPGRDPRAAYASLLVVQLLFGVFPVAVKKVVLEDGSGLFPLHILAVRVAGAALCLLALHALLSRNRIPVRKEFPHLALLTLLGVVLNMGMFLVGLQQTEPLNAVLIITTIPVFTYALAVLLKRETLGPRRALGIALAMAGVVSLVHDSYQADAQNALGDLLILANALSFAGFLVLAKPTMDRYDPLSVTTWMFVFGAVVTLPLGLLTGLPAQVAALPGESLGWLLFIVLGPSVLTYLLNARALRHVPASTVAVFTYVQPLVTAVAAYLLLAPTAEGFLGIDAGILPAAALVFAGLWLVARRRPKVLEGQVVAE